MTALPLPTWSPTTQSTTRPTETATGTGPTTIVPGTVEPRVPPPTQTSAPCVAARAGRCSPRCYCPSESQCCLAVTSSAAPSRATTTATVRTTPSPGSTGPQSTVSC